MVRIESVTYSQEKSAIEKTVIEVWEIEPTSDEGAGAAADGEGEQTKEPGIENVAILEKEFDQIGRVIDGKTKGKSRKHGRRKKGETKKKHGGSILEHTLDGGEGEERG